MAKESNLSFKEKMLKYEPRIYRAIAQYVTEAATIEDLVQITFLKAYIARETFKGQSAYSTWLYRIAINTALTFLQKTKREVPLNCYDPDLIDNLPDAYTTEEMAITQEEMKRIYQSVNDLPSMFKEALVLHVIYGKPYEEVADRLNIPVGTVRSRIYRARFLLKERLRD